MNLTFFRFTSHGNTSGRYFPSRTLFLRFLEKTPSFLQESPQDKFLNEFQQPEEVILVPGLGVGATFQALTDECFEVSRFKALRVLPVGRANALAEKLGINVDRLSTASRGELVELATPELRPLLGLSPSDPVYVVVNELSLGAASFLSKFGSFAPLRSKSGGPNPMNGSTFLPTDRNWRLATPSDFEAYGAHVPPSIVY